MYNQLPNPALGLELLPTSSVSPATPGAPVEVRLTAPNDGLM